ncbi:hypothetical protein HDR66_01665 [bacterium]|nr:hypothetical protein [bacterium]
MNVKQLLDNIKFLAETTVSVRFGINTLPGHVAWTINKMPSIVEWNGDVCLECNKQIQPQIIKVLKEFGIDATVDSKLDHVVFKTRYEHDIVAVLSEVINRQRDQKRLRHYEGLDQNVAQLVQQLPHVKHGVFSRGVNAMKNQVQVLKNIREQKIR